MSDRLKINMAASAYLRVAARLRSFTNVNGICLVPAGLLGDAAGLLEHAAYEESDQDSVELDTT